MKNLESNFEYRLQNLENYSKNLPFTSTQIEVKNQYIENVTKVISHKWYTMITLVIGSNFKKNFIALIDFGADLNCIQGGLIPTKYFEKTTQKVRAANSQELQIKYKLSKAHICKK